ncbi:MAG: hypothetical protein ABWZ91_13440 [Nocardioides sp.]
MGTTEVRAVPAAMVLAVALVLVGCGEKAPSEAVPELADRLERVDSAIADDQPARARKAVDALVREANRARMDGEITADQADEILRAAAELLRRLPSGGDDPTADPTEPADPTGPTEPTTPDAPPAPEPHEHEKDKKGDKDDGPGKAKGHDEGKGPR